MRYCLLSALLIFCSSLCASDEYAGQFNYGQASGKGSDWVQAITVISPAYRSRVSGKTTITFSAPKMDLAEAKCWHQADAQQPGPWGYDAVLMPAQDISEQQEVSFVFPADEYPHGPINIRIATQNKHGKRDLCELQLYNEGGVQWNQGIPDTHPPAAKDLQLIFADDFNQMPSISKLGIGSTYMAHKPPNGSQDFSGYRFSHKDDHPGAHDPYEQSGTWLRIKARAQGNDKKMWGTGILAPVDVNYNGITAKPPFYMECRFIAQSAPGTWPAFWTLTVPTPDFEGSDELDIIEGYGGLGPGNPNDSVGYHCVSHFWGQEEVKKKIQATHKTHTRPPMMTLGGKSFWSTTFHTYGVYVDEKDTVYYFDNIEALRHPSGDISACTPAYFLINYAIGGISGWKIDLARYGNASDMWVDYVRVYSASLARPSINIDSAYLFNDAVSVTMNSTAANATIHYSLDGSSPDATSPIARGPIKVNKACTIKAIAMAPNIKPSAVISADIRAALAATKPSATLKSGLRCDYYEGKWERLPDFKTLKPKSSSITSHICFPEQRADDFFALRYSGYIDVPKDGIYTFFTESDDGSQLLIDGHVIVDNDGLHGAIERKAAVGLLAGKHKIEIRYLEAWGGESLTASWQSADHEKTPLAASILSHAAEP